MSKNPKTSSSGNKSHTTPKKGSKVEINSLKKDSGNNPTRQPVRR